MSRVTVKWVLQIKSCNLAKELNEVRKKQLKQVKIERSKVKNLKNKLEESEQLMHYMNLSITEKKEA